ncbi:FG-GAP repeat domain-containing protein [Streptomyces sp. NPDC001544]|uniref:FG-GAP repeat domain-containing protein n=1 Tax=Streptomyces sp. NPDC001544 TaxID=3364584 RepID=UPI0036C9F077
MGVRSRRQVRPGSIAVVMVTVLSTLILPGRAVAAACGTERGGWRPIGRIAAGPQDGVVRYRDKIRFADLDGDGRADYIVLDVGGGVRAWMNRGGDGNGDWAYRGRIGNGNGAAPSQIRFADVDGDGRDDYLVVNADGEVDAWFNRGGDTYDNDGFHPGWEEHLQFARGGAGIDSGWVQFADIDGDGKADYLVQDRTTGALTEWRNAGGDRPGVNGWEPRGQIARGGLDNYGDNPQFTSLRLADITCDGRDDYLALHRSSGAVKAWVNNGGDHDGVDGWAPLGQIAPGTGTSLVEFADINGDGRADYLVVPPDGSVEAYLNQGGDP